MHALIIDALIIDALIIYALMIRALIIHALIIHTLMMRALAERVPMHLVCARQVPIGAEDRLVRDIPGASLSP